MIPFQSAAASAQRCRHRRAGSPRVGADIINPSGVGRLKGFIIAPEDIDLAVKVHSLAPRNSSQAMEPVMSRSRRPDHSALGRCGQ